MGSTVADPARVADDVDRALAEDVGSGDVTASLIDEQRQAKAEVVCREDAVLAGRPWFTHTYARLDPELDIQWHADDGDRVTANSIVCVLSGAARSIVTGERTALNFLQTLSGTATTTRAYADELTGSQTRILDPRKTVPGLRYAQKYAVRCGGGANHRMGLYDAVLVKENHIAAAGGIGPAVKRLRKAQPPLQIEVEVETLNELEQALAAGADMVLLDNFSPAQTSAAVELVDGRMKTEISGNVELKSLAMLGALGADFISVGALTKHVRAVDFSMLIRT
jgi:nicotinate-nucleotide pyrophosphorylase (carboxylating)